MRSRRGWGRQYGGHHACSDRSKSIHRSHGGGGGGGGNSSDTRISNVVTFCFVASRLVDDLEVVVDFVHNDEPARLSRLLCASIPEGDAVGVGLSPSFTEAGLSTTDSSSTTSTSPGTSPEGSTDPIVHSRSDTHRFEGTWRLFVVFE